MMPSKSPGRGLLPLAALLMGATFWGVFWYPLRLLEAHGLDGLWTSLIIYGTATGVGLLGLGFRRADGSRRTDRGADPASAAAVSVSSLAVLGLASGWCNVAFILAMLEGNVVRVLLLFYLAPLWTVLLARFLLGETLSAGARLTMILAVSGAVVMLWDPEVGVPWPRSGADWLALTSGFAFALSNVTVRRLQRVPVWDKCLVAWAGVVAVAAAGIVMAGPGTPAGTAAALGGAAAIGLFGMVLMTVAVVYGMTHMPAHRAAVILLFELVIGAASAQWLTDERVQANEWAGGALILVAAWFAARAQSAGREEGRLVHPS